MHGPTTFPAGRAWSSPRSKAARSNKRGRAWAGLAVSALAADESGSVAICTELAAKIGPGLQRLIGTEDLDEALRDIAKASPDDAVPAAELIHALKRGKVYLVSQLADELVEEMGLSPLAAGKLPRLVARYDSCIVLANAHAAMVRMVEEPAAELRPARRGAHDFPRRSAIVAGEYERSCHALD